MKVFGHEVLESPDVPRGELWFAQPKGAHLKQQITQAGDLRLQVVQRFQVIGKTTNLNA